MDRLYLVATFLLLFFRYSAIKNILDFRFDKVSFILLLNIRLFGLIAAHRCNLFRRALSLRKFQARKIVQRF